MGWLWAGYRLAIGWLAMGWVAMDRLWAGYCYLLASYGLNIGWLVASYGLAMGYLSADHWLAMGCLSAIYRVVTG